ncbi:MAG: DUF1351 domain-containing protein [Spirochaetaceae bacterium]|nr:DUF1351 domain-containing protein [Spirochaetaceae bacterium]MBR4158634.1 DUF1351 domain-containing protein [Spirochaetia bacterium]
MELKINSYQLPEAISFNFEELKNELQVKTDQYTKLVYTEDNIKTAKEDRADLNRLKKALNDERLRLQREYMKPFEGFKKQVDEIIGIIDRPVLAIDRQIKEYEAIKQEEKRQKIEEMFNSLFFPEFVKLDEKIFNPKWLNASVSLKQIEDSLQETKAEIIRNCQTLATLPSYSHEAVIYYQRTLDVTGALAKVRELTEIEEAKKKMLANMAEYTKAANEYQEKIEQAAEQEKPALIEVAPVEIPVTEDAPEEPRMWVVFEAYLNKTQAAALKTFFNANGIEFKRAIVEG